MASPKQLLKGFEGKVENAAPNPKKRILISDESTTGLFLRITPRGRRTFTIVARDPNNKQVWREVGNAVDMTVTEARELAKIGVPRIKEGLDPFPPAEPAPPPPEVRTFKQETEDFLDLYVREKKLRSTREVERIFEGIVWPEWGERPLEEIRRKEVSRLLDKVKVERGPVMADRVLARLSKLFNWYASRSDDYVSPIIRGMARTDPSERARERILTDEEIRAVWAAADQSGSFGAFVKALLLSAQRRAKVATMRWDDIDDTGLWTIPKEAREKENAGYLPLPKLAHDIIKAQSKVEGNPYVFPGNGKLPMSGFSPLKKAFDAKVTELNDGKALERWTLHDLRRTARSLMSNAGVPSDDAERALGHKILGVRGIYDRDPYIEQKRIALKKLAAKVQRILHPQSGNVLQMRKTGRA